MNEINDIFRRNIGQTLTPELAAGMAQAVASVVNREPAPQHLLEAAPEGCEDFVFQSELIEEILDQLKPLHQAHFAETEKFRETEGCDPDYANYIRLERKGAFMLFTVRHKDTGELLGDAMVMINRNRHTQKWSAWEDALYLAPQARVGWTALKFIKYVERHLIKLGVTQVAWGCKMSNDISPIYLRAGYTHTAKVFTKVITND